MIQGVGTWCLPDYPAPLAFDYGWPVDNPVHISGPAPNHGGNGKINYLMADCHVEMVKDLWPWNDPSDKQGKAHMFHPKRNTRIFPPGYN